MVNVPTLVDGETPAPDNNGLPELVIEDSTPPDALAKEAAWERGENIDDQPVQEGVEVEAEKKPAEGVGVEEPTEPQSATPAESPPPPPKAPEESLDDKISRLVGEQTRGLQSRYDTEMAAASKAARLAQEQNDKFSIDAQVEAQLRRQEQGLAPEMGEDVAKKYVRNTENEESIRTAFTQKVENERLQESLTHQQTNARGQYLTGWVGRLQQEMKLTDSDVTALRSVITPASLVNEESWIQTGEAIGVMAEQLKTARAPSMKTQVPPETPETVPGSGRSSSETPSNDDTLTASAQEKPVWAWTKEEHEAMRRASHGGFH